jgi:hypothetical protein
MMTRRYRAYLDGVVTPFQHRHFARLDRQIVLVDLIGHLSRGADAVDRLDREVESVQRAMRVGASWLPRAVRPGIDRVLFAASKADHIGSDQHGALAAALQRALAESLRRTRFKGARTEVQTLAALRATREVGDPRRPERIYVAGRLQDGEEGREQAHFPGRLGADGVLRGGFAARAFAPPTDLDPDGPWPHLRLDRALDWLIGDRL